MKEKECDTCSGKEQCDEFFGKKDYKVFEINAKELFDSGIIDGLEEIIKNNLEAAVKIDDDKMAIDIDMIKDERVKETLKKLIDEKSGHIKFDDKKKIDTIGIIVTKLLQKSRNDHETVCGALMRILDRLDEIERKIDQNIFTMKPGGSN